MNDVWGRTSGHGVSEIGLERTICFGTCPEYAVLVNSSGAVRYFGGDFAPRKGLWQGKVPTWHFDALAAFIVEAGFEQLADSYTADITDLPTSYSSVLRNGQHKVVLHYGSCGPATLWAIETLIDDLVGQTKWDAVSAG